MAKIKAVEGQEILNAKGFPTIEATVILNDGKVGIASCPRGEKIGLYEAVDLEDHDENRFEGQGVSKAINNINTIITPALIGKEADRQSEIDGIMIGLDGTQNKSRIGANAMLAVSMAIAKAAAESSALPLFLYLRQFVKKEVDALRIPVPIFNFINGNHENRFAVFSEFLIVPASSKPYLESIQIEEAIRKSLKQIIEVKYAKTQDDYGEGFTPDLTTNKEAFALIQQAIESTHVRLGFDVFFGLNSRASTFFKDGKYHIKDNPAGLSSENLISYYEELNKDIHLLYMEDPLDQDDWDGWTRLSEKLSETTIIAGGDLIATNPYRLQMAIDKKAANAIVIKPNQIGTVIESLAIAEAAKETGLRVIVSHRSNETNDDFLSDFSVAISADYIKIGSLARGENIAKYNRLLQIDNQLKVL
ncbi:MAG: enolase C-terminal domain-like protein [Candidatus Levybacteria bacterium]|nr:enolase C-terminal domain-like protein [Candidatus Levybacteria bacterium]